jgi:glycosyltransferase involved in cell wall biosynthesis
MDRGRSEGKTNVLFLNTPTLPPLGADVKVHGEIMRHLDQTKFRPYAACTAEANGGPTETFQLLRDIPGLTTCPVNLGREGTGGSHRERVRNLLSASRALGSLVKLVLLVRRNKISIVHTTDRPRDALCCVLLGRITRAHSVVHLHVGHADWMSRMRKWSIRNADVVITVSDFVKQTVVETGQGGANIHPVLNGIDINRSSPNLDGTKIRKEFKIPPGAPIILSVCRLFPSKGPEELIRVLPSLVDEWPDVRLVLVGAEMEPGYRARLEQLAHDLCVEKNVVFTGWRSDVQDIMAGADVFAMPSIGEPCALVYLEAMAMSLPVIALTSGGTPELVDHATTGLLSSPGDEAMLAQHLQSLLRSTELRRSMGSRGRERVETYFTAERMARDIERVYEGILA